MSCTECDQCSDEDAVGWAGYLVDLNDDGEGEVAFICPICAAREFGIRASG